MNQKSIARWSVICALAAWTAGAAHAAPLERHMVSFYAMPLVNYNTFTGDKFGGRDGLVGSFGGISEFIFLPGIDSAFGYGGAVGLLFATGRWPVELGFQFGLHGSQPKASSPFGPPLDAELGVSNFDFRTVFRSGKSIQPGLLIGYNASALTIKKGAHSNDGVIRDAHLYGGGLNLGATISYRFHQHVSVDGAVIHRWTRYTQAEGRLPRSDIRDALDTRSLSGQISFTLYWGLRALDAPEAANGQD